MSRLFTDKLTGSDDDCGWVSGSSSCVCLSTSDHTGQSHRLPVADDTLKLLPVTPPASHVYCSSRQHASVPVTGVAELTAAAARGSCTGSLQCKMKVNPALRAAAVAAAAAQHVGSSSTITSAAAAMMKYTANALAKSTQGSSSQQQHLEQQHLEQQHLEQQHRHQQGWSQPQQWQRIQHLEQQQFHHQQHQHKLHAQQRQQQQCNHWRQHVTRQVPQNNGSSSRAAGRSLGLPRPDIQATVLQQMKLSSSPLHQQKLKSLPSPANSLPQADDVTAGKTEHALNDAASPAGSVAATCGSSVVGVVPDAAVVASNLLDDATGNVSGTEALAHQQRHTDFCSNNSSHSSSDTSSSSSDGGSVGGQYVAPRRRSRLSSNSSSSGRAGSSNSSSSGCVCATQFKQSLSPFSSSWGGSQAAVSGEDHIKCSSSGSGSLRDVRPAAVPAAGVDALQLVRRPPSLRQKIQGTTSTGTGIVIAAAAAPPSPVRYSAPSSSSSSVLSLSVTTATATPAVVMTTSLATNLKSSSVGCSPAHITAHDSGSVRGGESAVTGPQGSGYVHSTQGGSSREVCLVHCGSLLQPDLESRTHHSSTLHHYCSSGSGSNSTVQSLSGTRDQHTLLDAAAAATGFVPAEAVCSCEHVDCGDGDMLMMNHHDNITDSKPGCQNGGAGQSQAAAAGAAAAAAAAAGGVILTSSTNQPETDSESGVCAGTPTVQNMKHNESSSAVAAVGSVALTPALSSQHNSHQHHGIPTAVGAAQELPSAGQQQQQQQTGASNAPATSAAPEDIGLTASCTSAQQQQQPVITAGIPYTVVTSLQAAAAVAVHPTPRTVLKIQLQKLEGQAALMNKSAGEGDGDCCESYVDDAVLCPVNPPTITAAEAAVEGTPVVAVGGGGSGVSPHDV